MRTYRSESRRPAGPHAVEVAVPAGSAKPSGFIDAEGHRRKGSKRKVDRPALCFQTATAQGPGSGNMKKGSSSSRMAVVAAIKPERPGKSEKFHGETTRKPPMQSP